MVSCFEKVKPDPGVIKYFAIALSLKEAIKSSKKGLDDKTEDLLACARKTIDNIQEYKFFGSEDLEKFYNKWTPRKMYALSDEIESGRLTNAEKDVNYMLRFLREKL